MSAVRMLVSWRHIHRSRPIVPRDGIGVSASCSGGACVIAGSGTTAS